MSRAKANPSGFAAIGFWRFSAEYLAAAMAVEKAGGEKLWYPALQLYGHTIELALKAFLLKRGLSLSQVKQLSHRLSELLSLARRRRLGREVKFSRNELLLIRLLDENYSTHRFRYITAGATRVPRLLFICKIAERLVLGLERYCTGFSRGLRHVLRG